MAAGSSLPARVRRLLGSGIDRREVSPRGAMALLAAAKSWAFMDDRGYVVPEDVQAVLPAVVEHRLRESADHGDHVGSALAQRLLSQVDVVG